MHRSYFFKIVSPCYFGVDGDVTANPALAVGEGILHLYILLLVVAIPEATTWCDLRVSWSANSV